MGKQGGAKSLMHRTDTSYADNLVEALSPGMGIITTATREFLHRNAHCPHAAELHHLHTIYCGKTKFSRKQQRAVAAAYRTHKTLPAIMTMEKQLRGLTEQQRWTIREELLGMDLTPDELRIQARQRAKTLQPPREENPGVRLTRGKKFWKLCITGVSHVVADMKTAVGDTWDSAKSFFFSGAGAVASTKRTNVIIPLDQLTHIQHFHGDDIMLRMTNGATISGAELVQQLFDEQGLATLVHPVHGPVNLYRTQRNASWKQRQMAWAENPTCAWPGCNRPAEECQVHHMHAWKHGGETNPENLVTLCPYHNGVNDDAVMRAGNPPPRPGLRKPSRGRVERCRDGHIIWVPPWASPGWDISDRGEFG